jgi:hypothetical protein
MDGPDDDSTNQNDMIEGQGNGREEFRDEYLDDLEAFREKFEQMGMDVSSESGEKNLFRWFTYWRKEVHRYSRRNQETGKHVIRFPNAEDFFKFIHHMHHQDSDEPHSIDPQGYHPKDRHMDEESRKRRDSFRKEWR